MEHWLLQASLNATMRSIVRLFYCSRFSVAGLFYCQSIGPVEQWINGPMRSTASLLPFFRPLRPLLAAGPP